MRPIHLLGLAVLLGGLTLLMLERSESRAAPGMTAESESASPVSEVESQAVAPVAVAEDVRVPAARAADSMAAVTESLETLLVVRVVSQHGAPVAGAQVLAMGGHFEGRRIENGSGSRGGLFEFLHTDAEGRCTLEVPHATRISIRVSPEEQRFEPVSSEHEGLVEGEARTLEVSVVLPEGWFFGLAVAVEDGRPLSGVPVYIGDRSMARSFRSQPPTSLDGADAATVTDADGRFQLSLEEANNALAVLSGNGWGRVQFQVDDAFSSPQFPRILRLQRSATLAGRVDRIAEPASEASVRVTCAGYYLGEGDVLNFLGGSDPLWSAAVGVDGSFELRGLPAEIPLEVSVMQGRKALLYVPDRLTLAPGETRWVEWTVGAGATVHARAINSEGEPQAGVRLGLYAAETVHGGWTQPYHDVVLRGTTDADGRVDLQDVSPGEWGLGPEPERRAPGVEPGEWDYAPIVTRFVVEPLTANIDVELRVHRGIYIRGQVVGPADELVSNGYVSAVLVEQSLFVNTEIGESGEFVLGPLSPGRYTLRAAPPRNSNWRDSDPVAFEAGTDDVQLRVLRGGGFRVRMLDAETRMPQAGWVWIHPTDREGYSGSSVDSTGEVHLKGHAAGLYHVIGASTNGRLGVLRDVTVTEGQEQGPVDLLVEEAGSVRVFYEGPSEFASYSFHQDGVKYASDGIRDGTSTVKPAPPGTVEVRLVLRRASMQAGGTPDRIEHKQTVTVTTGEQVVVRFELDE